MANLGKAEQKEENNIRESSLSKENECLQGYVLGFIFNKDKTEVALIRKNRPAWQNGLLNGIGGKIEINESPIDAMTRECIEETTQNINSDSWKYFAKFYGEWGEVFCFAAIFHDLSLLVCEESENIEVIKVNKLYKEKHSQNISFLIPMALCDNVISASINSF